MRATWVGVLGIVCGCGARVVTDVGTTGHGLSTVDASSHDASTSANRDAAPDSIDAHPDATDVGVADRADNGTCDPDAMPPYTAVNGCFESTYCPPTYFASTHDQLTTGLGVCDTNDFACCGEPILDQVLCGPRYVGDLCCYTAFTRINVCTGREPVSDGGPPGCVLNGQPCSQPSDCCSDQCNVYFECGPVLCRPDGSPCSNNEQCCGGQCRNLEPLGVLCWHCIDDGAPCGDAGVACCHGSCSPTGQCPGA